MIVSLLQTIVRPAFGSFEREEFKKFLRMGSVFSFIIGAYWTIRTLKDAIFISLVDKLQLPWAKTASLISLFFVLMIYTKLLDKLGRERMFYTLALIYSLASVGFAVIFYFLQADAATIAMRTGIFYYATKVLGYLWYVYVESFGSLVVALFWAIVADTTDPNSAKKGFPLVVAIGQMGGIFGPYFINNLPAWFNFQTSAISVLVAAGCIFMLIPLLKNVFSSTPKNLMVSFHGKNEKKVESEQEPGFLEGLRLLLQHKYLLGIFGVIFFFEAIVTIFDFHFKSLAATHYGTGPALAAFLGKYGSYVNIVSLVCLLLGVSNITRVLGVGTALVLMPLIIGGAIFGFMTFDSIYFLFWLMVGSKAINYALNGPALKQLYIPTTHDVRFKAQAWVETFGSRGSKEAGSIFNMTLQPLQKALGETMGRLRHIQMTAALGFGMVLAWLFIAIYLGKTYKKAVDNKTMVC